MDIDSEYKKFELLHKDICVKIAESVKDILKEYKEYCYDNGLDHLSKKTKQDFSINIFDNELKEIDHTPLLIDNVTFEDFIQ